MDVEQHVHVSASSKATSVIAPSAATVRVINCTRFSFAQFRPSSQTNIARRSSRATPEAYALSSPGCAAARFTSIGGVQCAPPSFDADIKREISLEAISSPLAFCAQYEMRDWGERPIPPGAAAWSRLRISPDAIVCGSDQRASRQIE